MDNQKKWISIAINIEIDREDNRAIRYNYDSLEDHIGYRWQS